MARVRPWLVIPLLGLASAAIAFAIGRPPIDIAAIALLGAALAAAIRALGGPSLAIAVTAGAGAALGVLGVLALDRVSARGIVGGGAAMFAVCELTRAKSPGASPWPALGAALVAGVLDPSYIALVPVAGMQLVVDPAPRPRWVIAVPIIGVLAGALAIVASCSHLFEPSHPVVAIDMLARAGDMLGPLVATAALAGLGLAATRGRFAAAAVVGIVALTTIDIVSSGAIGPALPILAALGAGVAIGRLAAMVRAPIGQACVGAAAGFVLVVVPAWALL